MVCVPECLAGLVALSVPVAVEFGQRAAGWGDAWPLRWETAFIFVCTVIVAMEVFLNQFLPRAISGHFGFIPVRARHLDILSQKDHAFISLNRLLTAVLAHHLVRAAWNIPRVVWRFSDMTLFNTVFAVPAMYLVYDALYTPFHRALHQKAVYDWVHMHHHRQLAPSRGNIDAINVHPFEYVVGEYLHLFAIWIVPCHAVAALIFVGAGGVLASLNHTRHDVAVMQPLRGSACASWLPPAYAVAVHDLHHRVPMWNFGQYSMIFDFLFGTFRAFREPSVYKELS